MTPAPPWLHLTEHRPPGRERPLVVLVHGSMDRSTGLARVRTRLADLHVVVYDRRGYHRSRSAPPASSLDDHLADLLAVLDGRRAIVAGHSYGGTLALTAAVRHPDLVQAVLAYEPPLPWLSWWPSSSAGGDAVGIATTAADPAAGAEAFMRRAIGSARWERLPEQARADRRAEGPALVGELRALRTDPPPFQAGDVGVPAVLGCGSRSLPHQRAAAAELARTIPGSELVEVPGAAHGAPATHPDAYAALVRRAVARAAPLS
ncbi:MAG: alpha/beta fold hydrolase [Acidimicrobiales bacterium]